MSVLRRALTLALALVLTQVAASSPADGAPSTATKKSQIESLKDQVEEASAEEVALLGQIDGSNLKLSDLDGKLSDLDDHIAVIKRQLDEAQVRLDDIQAKEAAAERDLDDATRALTAAREDMRKRAVAAYVGQPPLARYADFVLNVRDMRELAASSGYLQAALDAQAKQVKRTQALEKKVAQLHDELDRKRTEMLAQRDVVAEEAFDLEDRRRAHEAIRQQANDELARKNAALVEIQLRKGEFELQILALQGVSNDLAALLRQLQAGQVAQPSGKGVLSMPVDGPVTSSFGPRVHPIYGDARMHTGVDMSAPSGAPIRASADGLVVSAGPMGGYGNATVIDHGNALATLYGHQSRIDVAVGQRVTRGQVIGAVGCTGSCTGPHLHFEVRVNGTPVNPLDYL